MIIKIRPQNLFSVKQADGNISVKKNTRKLEILWQGGFQFRDFKIGREGVGWGSKVVV